jgi:hypothetical protein
MRVHRDPFARGAYRRLTLGRGQSSRIHTCHWCGQERDRLYAYAWESDARSVHEPACTRWYCNFDCFRSAE